MSDLLRGSALGQTIRLFTGNKVLQYPEERTDFIVPLAYLHALDEDKELGHRSLATAATPAASDVERQALQGSHRSPPNPTNSTADGSPLAHIESNQLVLPRTSDGTILVDWYTTNDPANPQNWSLGKRNFVCLILCLYTWAVYCGSAIYTSSIAGVIQQFGISTTDASLPLSLYVLAYGIGPMIFAPLSEIPSIGRSPVYLATFVLFFILSIPTAVVENFAGLLVLRFLQGFFGSPCLANGGASLQDMYDYGKLPYAMTVWVAAAFCGPSLGPLISGFAVTAKGWRWSLWEIVWYSAPILLLMFLCLPETSASSILLRRARRLRKLTGNDHLRSQSEIDQRNLKPSAVVFDAMIKPFEITLKDPAIAFVNIYTSLTYGIYYSFFEVFPLVYTGLYSFSTGMIGVVFLCVLVSVLLAIVVYASYIKWHLNPDMMKNGMRAQEQRLLPALFGCLGPPVGLFLFAWTANQSIHWIAPTIGIVIYSASIFIVMQCIFVYIPMSYPQVSLFSFLFFDACLCFPRFTVLTCYFFLLVRRVALRWE